MLVVVMVMMVVFVLGFESRVAPESIFFHLEAPEANTMRPVVPELVVLLYAIRVDVSRWSTLSIGHFGAETTRRPIVRLESNQVFYIEAGRFVGRLARQTLANVGFGYGSSGREQKRHDVLVFVQRGLRVQARAVRAHRRAEANERVVALVASS